MIRGRDHSSDGNVGEYRPSQSAFRPFPIVALMLSQNRRTVLSPVPVQQQLRYRAAAGLR